jgi:ABC-type nitrate/sulfonate/bicarbonate transport system permease component
MMTFLLRAWLPTLLIVVWWVGSAGSSSLYFPPLQQILETFRQDWLFAQVGSDLMPSLVRLVLGFLTASVGGVLIGTLLGLSPRAKRVTEPVVQFMRAIPPPALLPVALLFFGITSLMNVAIIVIGAIWPTLLNTADGVRSVDPQLKDFARSYRLSFRERLFKVVLPSAGPQIFAGLRTTLQLSIVLIVVSEMIGAVNGVGFYVLNSQQTFAINETWAGTIVLGIIGYFSTLVFLQFEKWVLAWQLGMKRTAEGA